MQDVIAAKLADIAEMREVQKQDHVRTLDRFILGMRSDHADAEEMRSGVNDLITIWNRYQATWKTRAPDQVDQSVVNAGPGTPPEGATYGLMCECGRGGKTYCYHTRNEEYICEDCAEDLQRGEGDRSEPPEPPPDRAPCDLEDEAAAGDENYIICHCGRGLRATIERNEADHRWCKLCVEEIDHKAKHRCKCSSGKAATLHHEDTDCYRCIDCTDCTKEEMDRKVQEGAQPGG